MIIILFGLSGAGKNFVGEIFATHFNYHYWDADQALPVDMKNTILNQQEFTQIMRDRFTEIIIEEIANLHQQYPNLVVSQALYKEKNRQHILKAYPDAIFVHVTASIATINTRLKKRHSWVDEEYAAKIMHNFEVPKQLCCTITNDSNQDAIVSQVTQLFY